MCKCFCRTASFNVNKIVSLQKCPPTIHRTVICLATLSSITFYLTYLCIQIDMLNLNKVMIVYLELFHCSQSPGVNDTLDTLRWNWNNVVCLYFGKTKNQKGGTSSFAWCLLFGVLRIKWSIRRVDEEWLCLYLHTHFLNDIYKLECFT